MRGPLVGYIDIYTARWKIRPAAPPWLRSRHASALLRYYAAFVSRRLLPFSISRHASFRTAKISLSLQSYKSFISGPYIARIKCRISLMICELITIIFGLSLRHMLSMMPISLSFYRDTFTFSRTALRLIYLPSTSRSHK